MTSSYALSPTVNEFFHNNRLVQDLGRVLPIRRERLRGLLNGKWVLLTISNDFEDRIVVPFLIIEHILDPLIYNEIRGGPKNVGNFLNAA